MLDELEKKLINNPLHTTSNLDINCTDVPQNHNLAIAIFTLMAYSTTEEQLTNTHKTVIRSLNWPSILSLI